MFKFDFYKDVLYRFIRRELKNYPKINYYQRIWRHRNDEKFVCKVMNIKHPDMIEFKKFGDKHPEKNIYFISFNAGMGLGGCLKETILGLVEADHLGFTPVVFYPPKDCPYAEEEKVNGTDNPFEYYFEQVADIPVEDVYESARVFLYHNGHAVRAEYDLGNPDPSASASYFISDSYLNGMARVLKKYIRLNSIVDERVSADMNHLLPDGWMWDEKKVLGVHVRGTDYALNWMNHPNMVTVDEFIQAIDEIMETYDYEYVFLATDDKRRVDSLSQKYGSKLICYKDVFRGDRDLCVALEKNDRPLHHYLCGLEVIRDMYTLARCDSLVCGLSQISILAQTICIAENRSYRYLKVLDKGIYHG